MPNPKEYDNKDDFIKVCIPQVLKDGTAKDNEQAVAVCNTMWDKKDMKFDTVNIGGAEIFETGVWKGDKYTEKDLDEMVENFNKGVAEPYITIDHSAKATGQFKDALQALALGFVSKLARQGKKLIADFKQVPKTIADLISAGALKKKSIEFYRQAIINDKLYKNVLQGVTFHGANGLPEVNTLSDFLNLYKKNLLVMSNDNKGIVSLKATDLKNNGGKSMDDITIMKSEYDRLVKLQQENENLEKENEDLKEDAETKDEEIKEKDETIKEQESEIKEKDEAIKETEEKEKEELKKEANNYISKKVNDGYIRPAHKERYVREYIEYKKDDKLFKDFQDDIESRTKIINFTPTDYEDNQNVSNFKYEPEKLNYKAGATINYEELNAQIEAVMKAKNITFKEACIECGVAEGAEFGFEKEA